MQLSVIELSWGVLLSCVILALSSSRIACVFVYCSRRVLCHVISSYSLLNVLRWAYVVMCLVTLKVRCDVSIVNVSIVNVSIVNLSIVKCVYSQMGL